VLKVKRTAAATTPEIYLATTSTSRRSGGEEIVVKAPVDHLSRKRFIEDPCAAKEDDRPQNQRVIDVGEGLLRAVPVAGDVARSIRIDNRQQKEDHHRHQRQQVEQQRPPSPEVLARPRSAGSPRSGAARVTRELTPVEQRSI
jgi:hypothetical protein